MLENKQDLKIWKTIKLGVRYDTSEDFLVALEKLGCDIDKFAIKLTESQGSERPRLELTLISFASQFVSSDSLARRLGIFMIAHERWVSAPVR